MREAFRDIVSGWTLHAGIADLTERIEATAEWTKANGPLEPDEEVTVKLMIEAQIARGGFDGTGEYDPPEHVFVFTNCNGCGIKLRTKDEDEMGLCERCAAE
jgi:hypothetical protein